jgi:hypothetical protein
MLKPTGQNDKQEIQGLQDGVHKLSRSLIKDESTGS